MTKAIASRQNAWFKRVRDAVRDHASEIVIEGPKMVADAIDAGWKPLLVAGRGSLVAGFPTSVSFSTELFDVIAETKTPQAVLALFERPAKRDVFARHDSIVVALDAVQDPGNVGTIIRLAAAFDAAGVALLPGCADPFGPKAIRASAGAILNVPVAAIEVKDLRGRKLFAADGNGTPIDPPARGAVLIFGSEGRGVSPELLKRSTPISIRTSGRVESLNVGAAAAILLKRSFDLRT